MWWCREISLVVGLEKEADGVYGQMLRDRAGAVNRFCSPGPDIVPQSLEQGS